MNQGFFSQFKVQALNYSFTALTLIFALLDIDLTNKGFSIAVHFFILLMTCDVHFGFGYFLFDDGNP